MKEGPWAWARLMARKKAMGTLYGRINVHGHVLWQTMGMSHGHVLWQEKGPDGTIREAKGLGWPEPYIHTVHDRMYGDFPAKNTVYTPYVPINVWFWPTLQKGSMKLWVVLTCRGMYFRARCFISHQ